VSFRLLPSLLLGHGSIANQKPRRAVAKRKEIEVAQSTQLPEPPRQHNRKRDLTELNAGPIRRTVDPEVLSKAAVGPLRTRQIDKGPHRRVRPAACEQGRGSLHHVA